MEMAEQREKELKDETGKRLHLKTNKKNQQ